MEVRFLLTSYYSIGAEGGIRTHGRLQTYANFQDWCHKPTRPPLHWVAVFNNIYILAHFFILCQQILNILILFYYFFIIFFFLLIIFFSFFLIFSWKFLKFIFSVSLIYQALYSFIFFYFIFLKLKIYFFLLILYYFLSFFLFFIKKSYPHI